MMPAKLHTQPLTWDFIFLSLSFNDIYNVKKSANCDPPVYKDRFGK